MIITLRWVPDLGGRWWLSYWTAGGRVSGLGATPLAAMCDALAAAPAGALHFRPWP